jgi:hypothetical protein
MKYRILFSSLLWLAVCLPLTAQTSSWQPSRPVIPAEAQLTEEERSFFQEVMNRLVEIGLLDRAMKMKGELAAGRIAIFEDEPGASASTVWHLAGAHAVEVPSSALNQWLSMRRDACKLRAKGHEAMARTREADMRLHLLEVALTVDHGCVHLEQTGPSGGAGSEDPVWRHRLDQEKRIIRELSEQIAKLLATAVDGDLDFSALAALREDLRDMDQIHYLTVNCDLRERIKLGKLTASLFENDIKTLETDQAALVDVLKRADEVMQKSQELLTLHFAQP